MHYKDKFVGIQLYGFCNGYFGDTYTDKIIIASGENWIVAKDNKEPWFTEIDEGEMENLIEEWSKEEHDLF